MTSDITPITAASNGGTDTSTQDKPASPERGFARLQETQVYHLTALVQAALYEAEHMVRQAHDQARDRWLDHDNTTTEPLNADELSRLLSDAYQCATLASSYIDKAAMSPLDSGTEAPF
jgi:hypothetical protein